MKKNGLKQEMITLKNEIKELTQELNNIKKEVTKINDQLLLHRIKEKVEFDARYDDLFEERKACIEDLKEYDYEIGLLKSDYSDLQERLGYYKNLYNEYQELPFYKKIFKIKKIFNTKKIIESRTEKAQILEKRIERANDLREFTRRDLDANTSTIINVIGFKEVTEEVIDIYLRKKDYLISKGYLLKDKKELVEKFNEIKPILVNKIDKYNNNCINYSINSDKKDEKSELVKNIIDNEYKTEVIPGISVTNNPGTETDKFERMSELNKMKRKELKKIVKEGK